MSTLKYLKELYFRIFCIFPFLSGFVKNSRLIQNNLVVVLVLHWINQINNPNGCK